MCRDAGTAPHNHLSLYTLSIGDYRPQDLTKPPFSLPPPIRYWCVADPPHSGHTLRETFCATVYTSSGGDWLDYPPASTPAHPLAPPMTTLLYYYRTLEPHTVHHTRVHLPMCAGLRTTLSTSASGLACGRCRCLRRHRRHRGLRRFRPGHPCHPRPSPLHPRPPGSPFPPEPPLPPYQP